MTSTSSRDTRSFARAPSGVRSEEHTSELQSRVDLVCRLLLEKKAAIQFVAIRHRPERVFCVYPPGAVCIAAGRVRLAARMGRLEASGLTAESQRVATRARLGC